jgi:hypothetical protein
VISQKRSPSLRLAAASTSRISAAGTTLKPPQWRIADQGFAGKGQEPRAPYSVVEVLPAQVSNSEVPRLHCMTPAPIAGGPRGRVRIRVPR